MLWELWNRWFVTHRKSLVFMRNENILLFPANKPIYTHLILTDKIRTNCFTYLFLKNEVEHLRWELSDIAGQTGHRGFNWKFRASINSRFIFLSSKMSKSNKLAIIHLKVIRIHLVSVLFSNRRQQIATRRQSKYENWFNFHLILFFNMSISYFLWHWSWEKCLSLSTNTDMLWLCWAQTHLKTNTQTQLKGFNSEEKNSSFREPSWEVVSCPSWSSKQLSKAVDQDGSDTLHQVQNHKCHLLVLTN